MRRRLLLRLLLADGLLQQHTDAGGLLACWLAAVVACKLAAAMACRACLLLWPAGLALLLWQGLPGGLLCVLLATT